MSCVEKADGQRKQTAEIGERADVYSLGETLYALLTGTPPFGADSTALTLRQVIENEPVPPTLINPVVPRDLQTICLKCLQKAPERRYANAAELGNDLKRYLAGEPMR